MIFKETKSIYRQIADRLCDEILQGKYRAEERIPSVREYAATVEVNANTVVRSYDQLQSEEVIYNKRGIGYFVAANAVERIKELRRATFMSEELPEFFSRIAMLDIQIKDIEELYNKWKQENG